MKTATLEVKDLIIVPRGRKTRVQAALEALVQAAIDSGTPYSALRDSASELAEAAQQVSDTEAD